ncbi:hypothetical protein GF337_07790 [candidate division KSB1 bacterium]|nr:hypothetical protein [candidate division KSB1 bacterium]
MKRLIILAALFCFAFSAFGQSGMGLWPLNWGDPTTYVDYANPYEATGYIYHPSTYTWEDGSETNDGLITITCDIEMYMSMHLDATDVYFHIADDRTTMNAYINGWLASNNGQWLFVSSDQGNKDLDNLTFIEDIFGRDVAWHTANSRTVPSDIPIEWYLKEPTDADWRPGTPSTSGNNDQLWGYTWLLANGEPCTHHFTIKIKIMPAFHQPDGRYEMDPLVTVAPTL